MNIAFIVHINLQDVSTLADEASSIQDALEHYGMDVVSVEPWQRPTLQSSLGALSLVQGLKPPPTEPPISSEAQPL